MITLITFALWEKEKSVGVVNLENANIFTDNVTSLDVKRKVLNKFTISDIYLDLVFDEDIVFISQKKLFKKF